MVNSKLYDIIIHLAFNLFVYLLYYLGKYVTFFIIENILYNKGG